MNWQFPHHHHHHLQPSLYHRRHSSIKTAMQRQQPSTTVLSRNLSCCYIDDDDACDRSLDDMEAGFSRDHRRPRWSFVNGYLVKGPFVVSSPRLVGRTRYYEDEVEEGMRGEPHFLDSCFLCEKPLRNNNDDIFMYRGDTPFCSEECRQDQIELDQQRERNMNLSSSMRALWNKEQQQQEGRSNSPSKSPDRRLRTGIVAA